MGGNLQDQQLPGVNYVIAGADATAQITDRLRFYFEGAMSTARFRSSPRGSKKKRSGPWCNWNGNFSISRA